MWSGITENVPLSDKWIKGMMLLQPFDKTLKPKNTGRRFLSLNRHAAGQAAGAGAKYQQQYNFIRRRESEHTTIQHLLIWFAHHIQCTVQK
jgi:hypothetical protein